MCRLYMHGRSHISAHACTSIPMSIDLKVDEVTIKVLCQRTHHCLKSMTQTLVKHVWPQGTNLFAPFYKFILHLILIHKCWFCANIYFKAHHAQFIFMFVNKKQNSLSAIKDVVSLWYGDLVGMAYRKPSLIKVEIVHFLSKPK